MSTPKASIISGLSSNPLSPFRSCEPSPWSCDGSSPLILATYLRLFSIWGINTWHAVIKSPLKPQTIPLMKNSSCPNGMKGWLMNISRKNASEIGYFIVISSVAGIICPATANSWSIRILVIIMGQITAPFASSIPNPAGMRASVIPSWSICVDPNIQAMLLAFCSIAWALSLSMLVGRQTSIASLKTISNISLPTTRLLAWWTISLISWGGDWRIDIWWRDSIW